MGHQVVPDSDAVCELGHRGCLRALVAGDFVEKRVSAALGRTVTLEEVISLASQGEPAATEATQAAARAVGGLIGGIANVVDPDRVVISGEGSGLLRHAQDELSQALRISRHWAAASPEVVIADFDFVEWARGAAVSAMQSMLLGPELTVLMAESEGRGAIGAPGSLATDPADSSRRRDVAASGF